MFSRVFYKTIDVYFARAAAYIYFDKNQTSIILEDVMIMVKRVLRGKIS